MNIMRHSNYLVFWASILLILTLGGCGGSGGSGTNGDLTARQESDFRAGGPRSDDVGPGTGQPVEFSPGNQPTPTPGFQEFLVVLNTEEAIVFELEADSGVLTEKFRQNFGSGSLPYSVDARADGAVYITFTLANQIGHFQIDPQTGSLDLRTTITQFLPEGGAVSPDGRYFYHCEPLITNAGSVHSYSLDLDTGAPTELPGSPLIIPGAVGPQRIFIHPNGRFLYVAERNFGSFYVFEIATNTGALTQIGTPVGITADRAFAFATSPDGNTLFVTGNNSEVTAFAIDQNDGTLSLLSPTFVAQDAQLGEMVVDAVRGVFYVCGYTAGQVEAYRLDADGRPGPAIAGSPFSTSTPETLTMLSNFSGDFLLTTNVGLLNGGTVSCFRIQADGSLSPVPGSPFAAGVGTFDMALVRFPR